MMYGFFVKFGDSAEDIARPRYPMTSTVNEVGQCLNWTRGLDVVVWYTTLDSNRRSWDW